MFVSPGMVTSMKATGSRTGVRGMGCSAVLTAPPTRYRERGRTLGSQGPLLGYLCHPGVLVLHVSTTPPPKEQGGEVAHPTSMMRKGGKGPSSHLIHLAPEVPASCAITCGNGLTFLGHLRMPSGLVKSF